MRVEIDVLWEAIDKFQDRRASVEYFIRLVNGTDSSKIKLLWKFILLRIKSYSTELYINQILYRQSKNFNAGVMIWGGINACFLKLSFMLKNKAEELILRCTQKK